MTMQTETFQPLEQFGAPVLGSFSKGVPGAASLNMGRSGGANCDLGCRHHPAHFPAGADRDGICYAIVVENRHDRVQLKDKLDRHEAAPASAIVAKALHELEREKMHGRPPRPWFRFSTNGALPKPAAALADRLFIPRVRALLSFLKNAGTPCHLPVESAEKAAFYREQLNGLVVVRESIQTPDMNPDTIAAHPIPAGACSFTAGERVGKGAHKRRRILEAAAAAAAAWAKRTGRKTIVCPAVRVSFISRTKAGKAGRSAADVEAWRQRAKCGSCTACALAHIDVVYPAH
jgi:hypothetical protein